ncbi:hypothetical protein DYB32_006044 [Aphanomyces invadans]|uniref:Transmembrane protein n=1 Tax=Aphanomyces invadans TaxID=157072 RepID=A0A418ASK8_9STRA|nr:hypothetical protein DYB32_006044 [Aphanomyces invadans]
MKLDIQAVTGTSQFNGGSNSPVDNFAFVVLWPDDFSWTYKVRPTIESDFADVAVAGAGALSDPSTGYTALTVEITRDFNIYMALVFVGIWAVTIAIGYIGSRAVIWKTRAPDNPVIFVSALFAVPTFRNTTPGKPPYGCLFDVLCTYFSIGVIVTFLVLVAFAYMRKPKTDKPKKKPRRRQDDDTIPVATLDAGVAGDVTAYVGDVGDAGESNLRLPTMTASSDSNAGSFHSPTALLSSLAEDKEQLDKRMQLQLLTIAGLVVFFLGIAIPFTLTQAASENKVHGYQVLYSSKPYSPDNESLALDMVLSSISTETYGSPALCTMSPCVQVYDVHVELSIATTISDIPARLATNDTLVLLGSVRVERHVHDIKVKSFRVQVGPGTMVISPATTNVNTPMTTKIPLIKGSTAWYPFDKYLTAVDVEAFTGTGPFMGQKPDVIDVVMEMKTPEDFNWRYALYAPIVRPTWLPYAGTKFAEPPPTTLMSTARASPPQSLLVHQANFTNEAM